MPEKLCSEICEIASLDSIMCENDLPTVDVRRRSQCLKKLGLSRNATSRVNHNYCTSDTRPSAMLPVAYIFLTHKVLEKSHKPFDKINAKNPALPTIFYDLFAQSSGAFSKVGVFRKSPGI